MKKLDDGARQLAEVAAKLIATAEELRVPDDPDKLGVPPRVIRFLARAYIELRDQVRALHGLVDQTDPNDPIGVALTKVGLERRPPDLTIGRPRIVRAPQQVDDSVDDSELLKRYCGVMNEVVDVFVKYKSYVLRQWDGMDGCWTDCTGEVSRDEALRAWADRTDGGARRVSYAEIDYYRIFPGGTRMHWDGSEGRELHR